ncbi:hypothetical protein ACFPOI_44250 [Nonomuraea angiospora]|uniref:D-arabinose 1-dehydrogenase-like Zn-dependent alcohol dehydrogenase n=1 Tax=Nonomuraea angiospora TaxID=46172 RepID=A0ABR9LNH4_9ACTN|nr:D-arabinose 1-dehydrogenase-like Zn-dependent alcohol dehydrogenase [Nonomuraea angiospora]
MRCATTTARQGSRWCRGGQENFCHAFPTLTYGGTDLRDGSATMGGFSREYVVRDRFASTDPEQPAAARDRFDVVIDTISTPHDLGPYLRMVALDGTLSALGHLGPVTVETMDLLVGRKKLGSAGSGGRPATAAMLEFCAGKGITADIELLPSAQVNEALDRLRRNGVRYRFVLDMSDLS